MDLQIIKEKQALTDRMMENEDDIPSVLLTIVTLSSLI